VYNREEKIVYPARPDTLFIFPVDDCPEEHTIIRDAGCCDQGVHRIGGEPGRAA